MTDQTEIVSKLLEYGLSISLLVWMLIYFKTQLKKKDELIERLNESILERQVTNEGLMKDFISAIKELTNEIKRK